MYAVIRAGGKQYRVSEGETLAIDKLDKKPGETVDFVDVLLTVDGENVKIGQPTVAGAKVTALVLEQIKGEKVRTARFKAKARYRRVKGFRAQLTKIEIKKIVDGAEKKPVKTK